MYLILSGLFIFVFAVIAGVVALLSSMASPDESGKLNGAPGIVIMVMMFLIFPFYLWVFAYLQAKRTNLMYNNIDINGNKVQSELKTGYLFYLYVTTTLAMMISLGLLMPWAKIRTARYRASVTSLNVAGDLGQFTSAQEQQQSALGEEMGEMFDMDLGF